MQTRCHGFPSHNRTQLSQRNPYLLPWRTTPLLLKLKLILHLHRLTMPAKPSSASNIISQVCCPEKNSAAVHNTNTGMEMSQHTLFSQGTDIVAEQLSEPNLSQVYAWVQKNKRPYVRHVEANTLWKL